MALDFVETHGVRLLETNATKSPQQHKFAMHNIRETHAVRLYIVT
jgi:hypothetical protein